jgi:glutathione S-transferase
MGTLHIIGRSSSLFTRVPLIFAEELGLACQIEPIYDMTETDPQSYAGNPALKLPSLRRGDSLLVGAQNICRALTELAEAPPRIVWPEDLHDDLSRNAQELVWHAMAAQVQLVFGVIIGKLPADNVYFMKCRAGFEGSLRWLDDRIEPVLAALPPRDFSLFEVTLFCLIEHIAFRPTIPSAPYPGLSRFRQQFAARPSAQRTPFVFDARPK